MIRQRIVKESYKIFTKILTVYCKTSEKCYNERQVNNSEVESHALSVRGWGVVTERKALEVYDV